MVLIMFVLGILFLFLRGVKCQKSPNKYSNTSSSKKSHIFKESMVGLSKRTDIIKKSRVRYDDVHEVIFEVQQVGK